MSHCFIIRLNHAPRRLIVTIINFTRTEIILNSFVVTIRLFFCLIYNVDYRDTYYRDLDNADLMWKAESSVSPYFLYPSVKEFAQQGVQSTQRD